ncbi:MAG: hypothetical protein Q7S29_03005, partial [Candidatus Peribacter sp.]|nr:hypothetical protein [Candidatus Peribacter sp.]
AQVYAEYPSLYATCHAHAAAALRAEVQRPAPVATEAPNPAPTPAGRGEKPAAPAKPAKPAPKPAGKPATKPAVTGEIGLAGEPGGFDFSPVDTPDAAAPTGMDDIDFQIEKEPVDEDLERLLGLRTDDEKPKKPGRVDPSKPKR